MKKKKKKRKSSKTNSWKVSGSFWKTKIKMWYGFEQQKNLSEGEKKPVDYRTFFKTWKNKNASNMNVSHTKT